MILLGRTVEVVVSKVVAGTYFTTTDELTIRDLRVSFSVEKTQESTPNICTAKIWGLAPDTQTELQGKNVHVRIMAGYKGQNGLIFSGDLVDAKTNRGDNSTITELELADGRRAVRHARVSTSFKAGASALSVFKATAKSMGLTVPATAAQARELQGTFASGVVLSGPSADEMSRLLGSRGLVWSIQDGQLQVLPEGGAETVEAILVEESTGMVNVPSLGTSEKGKPPTLTVSKLIDPGALPAPGRLILMNAERVKGLYVVRKVTHVGDTGGAEWWSTMEAVAA